MNLETLQTIYKNSEITKEPLSQKDYLIVFDGFKYLNIPYDGLSESEVTLLGKLHNQKQSSSKWRAYLMGQIKQIDTHHESVQCIQFYAEKNSGIEEEWMMSLQSFFDNVIDAFYMSDHYGVILIKTLNISEENLLGIIDTLDVDYSTSTSIYIGNKTDVRRLDVLFKEEQEIFNEMRNHTRISKFSDGIMHTFVLKSVEKSVVAQNIRDLLYSHSELPQLIISMWKHQGNQSAVAKEIFVHRNTINYRIDKLYEEYNINLRDIDQLFICYILVR